MYAAVIDVGGNPQFININWFSALIYYSATNNKW